MSNHYDDHKIAEDFERMRQVDLGLTPRFSSLLKNTNEHKHRFNLLHPSVGFAAVVLTLSIVSLIVLRPDNNTIDPLYSADSMQLSSIGELPTDFLLETPWSQLASLGPGPQLLDLPDEYLEEPSNEP